MTLEKVISHDCSVLEDGQIQCREITRIMENGQELSKTYMRWVVDVGEDVSAQPQLIKDVATNMHTPERVKARAKVKAAMEAEITARFST